ncbi:hypothetical protein D918_08395 [Trichuris suis]|nr:hypothetical protein D918_08395 [Trichuris suis]
MQGRSHISASVIIKNRRNPTVRLVLLRDPKGTSKLAVDPMKICNSAEALAQPFQEFRGSDEVRIEKEATASVQEVPQVGRVLNVARMLRFFTACLCKNVVRNREDLNLFKHESYCEWQNASIRIKVFHQLLQ